MGFAVAGEGATSAEVSGPDETEKADDDESSVHQCASVGDVEVCSIRKFPSRQPPFSQSKVILVAKFLDQLNIPGSLMSTY